MQLLGKPGRAAADAEARAPPWSILMVHGKAVHYEEVSAVKMDEKIFEFLVEHTRKRSSRPERGCRFVRSVCSRRACSRI